MVTVTKNPLSDIADVKTGPFGSSLHASDYVLSGTPIITVEHLGERSITRQNLPLVSEADKQRLSSYCLQTDDIVFSRVGSVDRNAYVTEKENGWLFSGRLLRIRVTSSEVNPKYLSYYFKFEMTMQRIRDVAVGQTMPSLNTKILNSFVIEYPPLPEQRRIAEVLSDTDALLASMEKLIAKKRAIKQGAMQELLTGKRRLPGFEGEWVEKKLGEVVEVYDNLRIPVAESLREKGSTPYYGANGIQDYVKGYTHDGEFVLLAEDGANDLLNYPIQYVTGKVWVNNHAHVIKGISDVTITQFLGYALKVVDFQSVLVGGTRAKLNSSVMRDIDMVIPKHTIEQTVIAEILSDMDAEIDALTAKLNKLRNIKQGMMSELLTGRIRLTESEPIKVVADIDQEKKTEPIRRVAKETKSKGHNRQFDDAVMIAGIVDALYSDKYPLGRKKVQKCLYLLRRYQGESTAAFKKKVAGPYADEVRYKGGEPIAKNANFIATITGKQGTTFARGKNIGKALDYIQRWGKQADIKWVADKLKCMRTDDLELLATVDMAACDLMAAETPVTVWSVKHLIATDTEWKAKLKKQNFSDANIARALRELSTLLQGGN